MPFDEDLPQLRQSATESALLSTLHAVGLRLLEPELLFLNQMMAVLRPTPVETTGA
jgi:hypothetical protein